MSWIRGCTRSAGLLRRLWVLKLRARGSTALMGKLGVCVHVQDVVGVDVVEEA